MVRLVICKESAPTIYVITAVNLGTSQKTVPEHGNVWTRHVIDVGLMGILKGCVLGVHKIILSSVLVCLCDTKVVGNVKYKGEKLWCFVENVKYKTCMVLLTF